MRHFVKELIDKGFRVEYVSLNDASNTGILNSEIERFVKALNSTGVIVTHPGEYRVLQHIEEIQKNLKVKLELMSDD